jgi:hypothetical protein
MGDVTPQAQLEILYRSHWQPLLDALLPIAKDRQLSSPLLLDLNAHAYFAATVRLFLVGQQTNGWGAVLGHGGEDPIADLLNDYRNFNLGERHKRSPFIAACHELYRLLNPSGPQLGFVWSNLVRIDENGHQPGGDVEDAACSAFPLLPNEIALAQPDVVVFLSGPYYDKRIRQAFPGCGFEPLSTYGERLLARVVHPALPKHAYRTYHPGYLKRRRLWGVLKLIAECVH